MIGSLVERVRASSSLELAAVLTIPSLLVRDLGWQSPFAVALVAAALVHRPLLRRGELWLTIAALRIVSLGPVRWFNIPNEEYLVTWWCLALGVGLLLKDPDRAVATSARWILGIVFAVATFWKLAAPEFPDGTYFTYAILTDGRLGAVAHAVGVGNDAIVANRSALLAMLQPGATDVVSLVGNQSVASVARLMAIGTIVLEGLVAVTVIAKRWFPTWLRTSVLATFVLVAYALAPIVVFGWIVLVLAIAATPAEEAGARVIYVGLYIALPVLAHVATLGDAAIPTFVAFLAVGLFVGHVRGAGRYLRDGSVLLLMVALGQLLAAAGGVDQAVPMMLGAGLLVVVLLRLLDRAKRPSG